MTFLNQTQFAAHIGKSKGHVSHLKTAGRLVMSDDGKLVDVEASIKLIADSADANRDDVVARHVAEKAEKNKQKTKANNDGEAVDPTKIKFSEGRAKEQHYKALNAELEHRKLVGELVLREDMVMAVADAVGLFRQRIENIPHNLAPDLVGKDLDQVRAILREAMTGALGELERELNKKVEGVDV